MIFDLDRDARQIEITDLTGKVVAMVSVETGERTVQMDVSHLGSGLYLYKVSDRTQLPDRSNCSTINKQLLMQ